MWDAKIKGANQSLNALLYNQVTLHLCKKKSSEMEISFKFTKTKCFLRSLKLSLWLKRVEIRKPR